MPSATNLRQDLGLFHGIGFVLCSLCHSQLPLHIHDTIYAPQPGDKSGLLKETNFTTSKPQSYQTQKKKFYSSKHSITLSLLGSLSLWCSTHKWQTLAISSYGCINNRELSRKVNMYVLCGKRKKSSWLIFSKANIFPNIIHLISLSSFDHSLYAAVSKVMLTSSKTL